MKHFLLFFLLLTLVGTSSRVHAQTNSCEVTDLVIQNIRPVEDEPCTFTFDAAFSISSRSSKYIYFQSYVESSPTLADNPHPYPTNSLCNTATGQGTLRAPVGSAVGTPFLNILIDNSGDEPRFLNYVPDPSVDIVGLNIDGDDTLTFFEDPLVLPDGSTRFVIRGLKVTLQGELCTEPFVVRTDFFATNANNPEVIQCLSCGVRVAVGFFAVSGTLDCSAYNITFTRRVGVDVSGTFDLYVDLNDNQSFTPGVDVLVVSNLPFNLSEQNPTQTLSGALTGSFANYIGLDLIVVATLAPGTLGAGAESVTVIRSTCPSGAPLPVKFKSFNANRKNRDVVLTWETASEDNNRGFYVQRNNGGGWTDLGFVATKAQGGNSTSDLSYNYTDLNNTTRGVTQYRIMQVDIDGKSKHSDVRQVRGLDQAGKVTVYPNPSIDGKVNVVFDDSKATWNVSVSDMNGRTIKQYKGVTNSVVVDNLLPGMYMIRILDVQTGAQTNEKVIINNR